MPCVELGRNEEGGMAILYEKEVSSEAGPQAPRGPDGRRQAKTMRWQELESGRVAGWQRQETQKGLERLEDDLGQLTFTAL